MPDYSASIDVHATPGQVYTLWSDPVGWPDWDPDLESASLTGPFAAGSTGTIKAVGSPSTSIRLVTVEPGHSFVAEAKLPGCRMTFDHTAELTDTGSTVTHTVAFEGALSRFWMFFIGRKITRGLPGTMAGLKAAVESGREA